MCDFDQQSQKTYHSTATYLYYYVKIAFIRLVYAKLEIPRTVQCTYRLSPSFLQDVFAQFRLISYRTIVNWFHEFRSFIFNTSSLFINNLFEGKDILIATTGDRNHMFIN